MKANDDMFILERMDKLEDETIGFVELQKKINDLQTEFIKRLSEVQLDILKRLSAIEKLINE